MKKRIAKYTFLLYLTLGVLLPQFSFSQFEIPKVPSKQTALYDYANVLSSSEKEQLESKLVRYSDSTSTQIVVITIPDLKGEDIAVLATNWGQTWKIGQKNEDNGIVILVAVNDKKISIRPGYGLEDRLIAGTVGEIIRNIITPEFKAGSYYNGLDKGTDAIVQVLKGKYKSSRKGNDNAGLFPILLFVIVFILVLYFASKNNKNGGGNSGNGFRGPSMLDVIILSSLGRGNGGGFGGSSGGGFGGSGGFGGGFGGGGFSGGGASGSW